MVEKVLADQKGQNVEVYLEEIVVKSKDEQSLIKDVEETFNKLKWVNMKIDLNKSTFGMKEGRFLGYNVTEDGIRPDPAKIQTKLNSKAEVLTGLATIKLEFLNQEVLVGIKTRPSVEVGSDDKEGKATGKVPMRKPNYNWETSGSN
ncbi:hypothetical protein Tco_0071781 [Tanacetum coccineum]